jgi:hypothetical protein
MKALRIRDSIVSEHIVPLSHYFDTTADGTRWWTEEEAQGYEEGRQVSAKQRLDQAEQQVMHQLAKFDRTVEIIDMPNED